MILFYLLFPYLVLSMHPYKWGFMQILSFYLSANLFRGWAHGIRENCFRRPVMLNMAQWNHTWESRGGAGSRDRDGLYGIVETGNGMECCKTSMPSRDGHGGLDPEYAIQYPGNTAYVWHWSRLWDGCAGKRFHSGFLVLHLMQLVGGGLTHASL